MSGKPKFLANVEEINRLRLTGISLVNIAQQLNMSRESVRHYLERYGDSQNPGIGRRQTFDYSHIDPFWMSEFRGLFFGEGCVFLHLQQNKNSRKQIGPAMSLSMRDDDLNIIKDIHEKLEGVLSYRKNENRLTANPAAQWAVRGWDRVYDLIPYMLEAKIPSRKLREFQLLKECCEVRFSMPYQLNQDEYDILYRYCLQLRELKTYH